MGIKKVCFCVFIYFLLKKNSIFFFSSLYKLNFFFFFGPLIDDRYIQPKDVGHKNFSQQNKKLLSFQEYDFLLLQGCNGTAKFCISVDGSRSHIPSRIIVLVGGGGGTREKPFQTFATSSAEASTTTTTVVAAIITFGIAAATYS